MKRWTVVLFTLLAASTVVVWPQTSADRALRERIEERYDVVPLTDGLALRPKTRIGNVRLIEIADGVIAINGVPATGSELRERLGRDTDAILKLSYLSAADRQALFAPQPDARQPDVETTPAPERQPDVERPAPPSEPAPSSPVQRSRRDSRDRVRVFGDVNVERDEHISGQVVAVLGSVRIDGEVSQEVVAVLGSVELGPTAVVRGDIVAVGGRIHRAPGAEVRGGVTEVSIGDPGFRLAVPWMDGWGPYHFFGPFGAVPRLMGTVFRFLLLALFVSIAFVAGRSTVERSAERIRNDPVKSVLIGLASGLLIGPLLLLTSFVLVLTFIGIPLLLLLPFVVLFLVLLALIGYTGTAYAVGQWARRRLGLGVQAGYGDLILGLFVILLPVFLGRALGLIGWPASPFAFLLIAAGLSLEFLAWTCGFGSVIANAFSRWQARRGAV